MRLRFEGRSTAMNASWYLTSPTKTIHANVEPEEFDSVGTADFNRTRCCDRIARVASFGNEQGVQRDMNARVTIDRLSLVVCLQIMIVPSRTTEAQIVFEDVTQSVGLENLSGSTAAWADFDNDGWVDLYIGGQLWKNDSSDRFELMSDAGLAGPGIWADFDNDGWLDLFCWTGQGRVFRNVEGRSFIDVSDQFPETPMPVSLGACWGDFDGDGFVDLYLGGYETPGYLTDAIYRNRRDGSFEQVWQTNGKLQPARGITAADFDEDGDLDVYVSNYRLEPNLLWQNDGKGGFKDVSHEFGTAGDGDLGAWGHTIGSAWGDFDNDGHLDLFVGNFSHPPAYQDRTKFLRNLGPDGQFRFEDRSVDAGLHWQESYASPSLADFDNDGLLDLHFTTVYPGDRSVLYRNEGDWRFSNATAGSNVDMPQTYQSAWADYDNDGALDLVTGGRLFRNPGGDHHWLKIRLIGGSGVNTAAIGTVARIQFGDKVLTRQVEGATGQGNQNDLTLHFGLGDRDGPVTIKITWPGGDVETVESTVDRLLTVRRGN